jgi:outer membrane immunogenic protein
MIKRFSLTLLAATAIGMVASQGASAADMPLKAPPVVAPPPLWNWTGLYGGGVFGLGVSRNKLTETNNGHQNFVGEGLCFDCAFDNDLASGFGFDPRKMNLGTQIGVGPQGGFLLNYKWQAPNSPWVFGIDGQFSFADIQGSTTTSDSLSVFFPKNAGCNKGFRSCQVNSNHTLNVSSKVKDIATIAGLFGITSGPQDRTLWYVKGGGAWAKTSWNTTDSFQGSYEEFGLGGHLHQEASGDAVGFASMSASKSRWGWVVGTGVEWGLYGNWVARIEYDFLDFGSYDLAMNGNIAITGTGFGLRNGSTFSGSTPINRTLHVDQQIHLVQVGLTYKFDWANWGR